MKTTRSFSEGYDSLAAVDFDSVATSAQLNHPPSPGNFGLHLWDPHSCLNAMNRYIIETNHSAATKPLFLVAAHLQLFAQMAHTSGRANLTQLARWLDAMVALHFYTHQDSTSPVCTVDIPEMIESIEVAPIGRRLIQMLRHTGRVSKVTLRHTQFEESVKGQVVLDLEVTPSPAGGTGDGQMERALVAQVRCLAFIRPEPQSDQGDKDTQSVGAVTAQRLKRISKGGNGKPGPSPRVRRNIGPAQS